MREQFFLLIFLYKINNSKAFQCTKVILKYTTVLKENDVIFRDSRKNKAIIFMFFPSVRTKALLQDRKTLSLQTP